MKCINFVSSFWFWLVVRCCPSYDRVDRLRFAGMENHKVMFEHGFLSFRMKYTQCHKGLCCVNVVFFSLLWLLSDSHIKCLANGDRLLWTSDENNELKVEKKSENHHQVSPTTVPLPFEPEWRFNWNVYGCAVKLRQDGLIQKGEELHFSPLQPTNHSNVIHATQPLITRNRRFTLRLFECQTNQVFLGSALERKHKYKSVINYSDLFQVKCNAFIFIARSTFITFLCCVWVGDFFFCFCLCLRTGSIHCICIDIECGLWTGVCNAIHRWCSLHFNKPNRRCFVLYFALKMATEHNGNVIFVFDTERKLT